MSCDPNPVSLGSVLKLLGRHQQAVLSTASSVADLFAHSSLPGGDMTGIVEKLIVNPSVHKRMNGKFLSYARRVRWTCLPVDANVKSSPIAWFVLDTKFGGQDVSTGKCVAAMISSPQQHTSCSPQVIAASASNANLLHRARMPWILNTHVMRGSGMYQKSRLLRATSHGLGLGGLLYFWFSM